MGCSARSERDSARERAETSEKGTATEAKMPNFFGGLELLRPLEQQCWAPALPPTDWPDRPGMLRSQVTAGANNLRFSSRWDVYKAKETHGHRCWTAVLCGAVLEAVCCGIVRYRYFVQCCSLVNYHCCWTRPRECISPGPLHLQCRSSEAGHQTSSPWLIHRKEQFPSRSVHVVTLPAFCHESTKTMEVAVWRCSAGSCDGLGQQGW